MGLLPPLPAKFKFLLFHSVIQSHMRQKRQKGIGVTLGVFISEFVAGQSMSEGWKESGHESSTTPMPLGKIAGGQSSGPQIKGRALPGPMDWREALR
jgi:hypothetical protein